MSFRLSSIHDYNRFIAIDLGSYRVRASVYSIRDGDIFLEWEWSVRQNRKNFHDGYISDMRGVALTLERAIHAASEWCESIPDDIILAYSPEICIHDMITTQYARSDKDALITMSEIDTMISKIEAQSHMRAKEKSKVQYGVVHDDIRLISSTLTAIYIDGKRVSNPVWFGWGHIRITILNVFSSSAEFNILRSVVASLGKNIISLIPVPLLFSKITESTEYRNDTNAYIDIWHMHSTLVLESDGQIISFEAFPTGSQMLIKMLIDTFPSYTQLEIEAILFKLKPTEDELEKREKVYRQYMEYLIDLFLSVFSQETKSMEIDNFFLSWGIFYCSWMQDIFLEIWSASWKRRTRIIPLHTLIPDDKKETSSHVVTHGLALLAQELLLTKKDPVIRILRYVLYNYD